MTPQEIKNKYRAIFLLLDLDWHGYLTLKKMEQEELNQIKPKENGQAK